MKLYKKYSKLFKYLININKKKENNQYENVTNGFKRFDLPLLVSYPRSGTNFVRYFIEYTTEMRTPGQVRLIHKGPFCIDRSHRGFYNMKSYPFVILLLRNYKECLLRHNTDDWFKSKNVYDFLNNSQLDQPCEWYIKNIEAFEFHENKKLLLYYEDMINHTDVFFNKLGKFLDINEEEVEKFIKNIYWHERQSVDAYCSGGHDSYTSTSKDTCFHSRKMLSLKEKKDFDIYYSLNYPELSMKYLRRYYEYKI